MAVREPTSRPDTPSILSRKDAPMAPPPAMRPNLVWVDPDDDCGVVEVSKLEEIELEPNGRSRRARTSTAAHHEAALRKPFARSATQVGS
jgi:hypothetical protein